MKKVISKLTLISIIVLVLLSGCSSGGSSGKERTGEETDSTEKITLRMSIVSGTDEMKAWQSIVDAFNQSHPHTEIKLERLPGGWNEYNQKITAQIAAGNPPDIGRVGAAYMPMFSSKGQLEDLAPYLGDLNMDDYFSSAFDQYNQDGKMYGVPVGIYTMAMYYNKDMFEAAGIPHPSTDWNKAWTFEDLKNAASKLTNGEGANKQYGVYVNLNPERATQYFWTNGGDLFNDDKSKSMVNSPESKEALAYLQGLIKDGYSPTPADAQTMPPDQLFLSGKLGMLVEGQWMMPGFSEIDKFKWGVAPIPMGSSGKAFTPNFVDTYVVYKGSKYVREAAEAIQFFISEKSENILVDNNVGGMPVLKSVAESRKADMFNPLSPDEKEVWFQSVDFSQAIPFTTNWQEVVDTMMKKMDLVGFNELDASKAADDLAPELDKLLKKITKSN